MWTNHGTLTALYADIFIPNRDFKSNISLFPLSSSCWKCAVNGHQASRKFVALFGYHHRCYVLHKIGRLIRHRRLHFDFAGYFVWNLNFMEIIQRPVNTIEVHLDNVFAPFPVTFLNRILDSCDCLIFGDNVSDSEETGLHNGIDSNA